MNKLQIQLKKKEKERKDAAGKKSASTKEARASVEAANRGHVCRVCRWAAMVTAKSPQLMQHVDAKHAKLRPEECFPEIIEMLAAEAAGGGGKKGKK